MKKSKNNRIVKQKTLLIFMRFYNKITFKHIFNSLLLLPLAGLALMVTSCSSPRTVADQSTPESIMFDTLLSTNNRAAAVAIGASMGGHAGVIINDYMDKHADEVEDRIENVKIIRVAEGLVLSYDVNYLFKRESDEFNFNAQSSIDKLARVFNKFDKTEIRILGHSKSAGASDFNYALSKARAEAIQNALISNNIVANRLHAFALGEMDPIVESHPDVAPMHNARIELVIIADEALRDSASKGMKENVF